jgi:hypothetical protein
MTTAILRGTLTLNASETTPKRFDILAYTGGKLRVNGFKLPVVVDLQGLKAEGNVPIVVKHDTSDDSTLGQTDDTDGVINNGKTLQLKGDVTADPTLSPKISRVFSMAKRGHKWQASIGAQILGQRDVPPGETVVINGQSHMGPFTHAYESELRETSVLTMGADKKTRVLLAAAKTTNAKTIKGNSMNFEAWLKKLGLDSATLTEDARNALLQQYSATNKDSNDALDAELGDDEEEEELPDDETDEADDNPDKKPVKKAEKTAKKKSMKAKAKTELNAGDPDDDEEGFDDPDRIADNTLKAARRRLAADMRRADKINAKCGGDKMLCAKAIEDGWTPEKAELIYLRRAQRKAAPAGHRTEGEGQSMLQALQGGMLLRAGCDIGTEAFQGELGYSLNLPQWLRAGVNNENRQKAMEASWKYRDWSLVDFCKAACKIDGRETDGSNSGFIRAAVSGGSLPNIFTTNINALMIQKLIEQGDTTVGWTREADAANFQTMDRIRLTKGPRLTPHRRGQTADHATRSDQIESYKIARYSQQFALDEQDMIDDRFQALQDIPNEMGLACARLRPDLVYSIVMSNPTLNASGQPIFSASQPAGTPNGAAQSNLIATAGDLTTDNFQIAMSAMFNFLENGVGVGSGMTHCLIPAVLFGTLAQILQSPTIVIAGTAGTVTTRGSSNPVAAMQDQWGMVKPVCDQRLQNGVTDPVTGVTTAGSTTTWRGVNNKVPTIEVAYLRGSGRAPQVRQYMLDKGQWGIGWDVNLDIGAKGIEWRGMFESRK